MKSAHPNCIIIIVVINKRYFWDNKMKRVRYWDAVIVDKKGRRI